MRVALFALARSTQDIALATAHGHAALRALDEAGHVVVGDPTLLLDSHLFEARLERLRRVPVDVIVVLQTTFTDATMATRLAETMTPPIVFWAFPEPRTGAALRLNGFPALMLAAHALGRRARRCAQVWSAPERAPDLEMAIAATPIEVPIGYAPDPAPEQAAAALDRLAGYVGLVGEAQPGFDTCSFDGDSLQKLFGIGVARVSLAAFFAGARRQDADRIASLHADASAELRGLDPLDRESIDRALRCYAALADTADAGQLKGIAVRCRPELHSRFGCAICAAAGRLADELTPVGCDADVLGTVTARLLQEHARPPVMLATLVDRDDPTHNPVVRQCGQAPLAMRDPRSPAEAGVHDASGLPLLRRFALMPGPVTIARVSQARGRMTLVVGRGRMRRAALPFAGTGGVLGLDGGTGRGLDLLLAAGVEHQLGLVYGDVKPGLLSVASRLGLPVLDLDA